MKHLIKYESVKSESYHEVSFEDYHDFKNSLKYIAFTLDEHVQIKMFLEPYRPKVNISYLYDDSFYLYDDSGRWTWSGKENKQKAFSSMYIWIYDIIHKGKVGYITLNLSKMDDDWYGIDMGFNGYRGTSFVCSEWQGLMECLNYIKKTFMTKYKREVHNESTAYQKYKPISFSEYYDKKNNLAQLGIDEWKAINQFFKNKEDVDINSVFYQNTNTGKNQWIHVDVFDFSSNKCFGVCAWTKEIEGEPYMRLEWTMYKTDDDYFILEYLSYYVIDDDAVASSMSELWFECDELDGLMICLNEINFVGREPKNFRQTK